MYAESNYLQKFFDGILLIYLVAFSSIYYQCPGLYSKDGVLPVWLIVEDEPKSWDDWWRQVNVLRFSRHLGLSVDHGMELCCFLGMLLSFLALILKSFQTRILFAMLWLFYFSLFQAGQVFLSFQWDILLLEVGFLCIVAAPTLFFDDSTSSPVKGNKKSGGNIRHAHWNDPFGSTAGISLHIIRWLLFRLMFASGVVKLTSDCPTWWGLTALHWHYESQCIPTPVAWFMHHLPAWWHRWCVVATYFIEIGVPFLFFIPTSRLRKFSFYAQVFLQALIIITGNYNFFNVLTILLCLSLMPNARNYQPHQHHSLIRKMAVFLLDGCLIVSLCCATARLFSLYLKEDFTVHSEIKFTRDHLEQFLKYTVPISMFSGGVWLLWEIVRSLLHIAASRAGVIYKTTNVLNWALVSFLAITVFCASLVPYSNLHQPSQQALPREVMQLYSRLHSYEVVNSYGLFRRMTGVGGRPEVVLEGSSRGPEGPWLEYEFPYKPGNVSRMPPWVSPHQPRLDWQMWFAALSKYEHQPWLVHLSYRLLKNEPAVLKLLSHNPFPNSPPSHIRATRYTYHFAPADDKNKSLWWYREKPVSYMPPMSLKDDGLINYLKQQKIIGKKPPSSQVGVVMRFLEALRSVVNSSALDGFRFVAGVALATLLVKFICERFV